MDSGLTIRPFSDSDLFQVSALIRNTLVAVNSKDYDLHIILNLLDIFAQPIIIVLARQRDIFVAEETGRLVGTISLGSKSINGFFIAPDRQREGIGMQMLVFAEQRFLEKGHRRLEISASLTAVGFYEHCGYTRQVSQTDRRYGTTIKMVKNIDSAEEY